MLYVHIADGFPVPSTNFFYPIFKSISIRVDDPPKIAGRHTELIADAISHGVRIVACQMSMDIMGIHKEELIDGVELGGVATFIGSGEKSDMSLFI